MIKDLTIEKAIKIGISKGYRFNFPEDWYGGITSKELPNVNKYFESYNDLIRAIFPDYNFYEWKFIKTCQGYWKNIDNTIEYLKWLETDLNWSEPEDWYNISEQILIDNYGFSVSYYNYLHDIPKILYPDYVFKMWKFKIIKYNWWCNVNNQKEYLSWLEHNLCWSKPEDWYNINGVLLDNNYGSYLNNHHTNVNTIPTILYPDYKFKGWLFKETTLNFWKNTNNIIEYLGWLENIMGWLEPEDWYKLNTKILKDNYGSNLYQLFKYTYKLPKILYPDYNFLEWKFNHVGNNWWIQDGNALKYLKWLSLRLEYNCEEDWYCLTNEILSNNYGSTLVEQGLINIVKTIYPNYNWDESRLLKNSKTQARIFKFMKKLYPNNIVLNDDRKTIINPNTNYYLELDIYLPELNLAVEYDGETHYKSIPYFGGDEALEQSKIRDTVKDDICKELGIRLIRVPYFENDIETFLMSELNCTFVF